MKLYADNKETEKNMINSTVKAYRLPTAAPLNEIQRETRRRFLEALDNGKIALQLRENCLCGSNYVTKVAETDRFGLPFAANLCEDCGLLFTSPFIPKHSIENYYQDFYHMLHFGSCATPGKILYLKGQGTKIFRHVKDRLKRKDIKVLEVGCGTGSVIKEFCRSAIDAGFNVIGTGLEFSRECIECFEPEGFDIKMVQGGIDALDKSEGLFDLVIMSHVFEHFPEPDAELESIRHLIKDDALLYIEVPGIFSIRYRYTYNCEFVRYLTGAHAFNFNLTSLANLLNRNRFCLLWGNEEVESVFTPGKQTTPVDSNSSLIKEYLKDLETNHLFYESLSTDKLMQRLGISEIRQAIELAEQIRLSLPYRFLKRFAGMFRKLGIIK